MVIDSDTLDASEIPQTRKDLWHIHITYHHTYIRIFILYIHMNPSTKNRDTFPVNRLVGFLHWCNEVSGGQIVQVCPCQMRADPSGKLQNYWDHDGFKLHSKHTESWWSQERILLERWWRTLCTGSLPLKAAWMTYLGKFPLWLKQLPTIELYRL